MDFKLQIIYDNLDIGNYKSALSHCNKLLSKNPNNIIINSLKAYSLDKLGNIKESAQLCDLIHSQSPLDPSVLQTLSFVYKSQGRHDKIIQSYKFLFDSEPWNEEAANLWFMAIARTQDYKSLQLASIKISKQFQTPKYTLWTIISIFLQVDSAENSSFLLTLAERMMQKAHAENKILNFECLQLYLMILEKQSKYQDCIKLLNSDLGSLCKVDSDKLKLLSSLYAKSFQSFELEKCSIDLIEKNIDDWNAWTDFITISAQSPDSILKCKNFILEKQKNCTVRGPFLAQIHLYSLTIPEPDSAIMADFILQYFIRFGSTLVCFEDIKPYMKFFTKGKSSILLTKLKTILKKESTEIDQIRININVLKVEFFFSLENQSLLYPEWISDYNKLIPLGVSLDERERQFGDDLLIMAATQLLSLYAKNRNSKEYLCDALILLEYGLVNSKFNYHYKIILVRIYIELGAIERATEIYASLDIKQIQHDTLSYLICDDSVSFGCYEISKSCILACHTIYNSNIRETPEMIIQAFKFGTFSKIPEFINFKSRLTNSTQQAVAKLNFFLNELLHNYSRLDDIPFELFENELIDFASLPISLSDNRDRNVIPFWNNQNIFQLIHGTEFPEKDNAWIKDQAIIMMTIKSWKTLVIDELKNCNEILSLNIPNSLLCSLHFSILKAQEAVSPITDTNLKEIIDRISEIQKSIKLLAEEKEWKPYFENIKILNSIFQNCQYIQLAVSALTTIYTQKGIHKKEFKELHSQCNAMFKYFKMLIKNQELHIQAEGSNLWRDILSKTKLGNTEIKNMSGLQSQVFDNISRSWKRTMIGFQSTMEKRRSF